MSLLDNVRQLADRPPIVDIGRCAYCRRFILGNEEHRTDCWTHVLTRIVAALEAAERVTRAQPIADPPGRWGWDGPPSQAGECVFCRVLDRGKDTEHATVCPWQALVSALKGAPA